MRKLFISNLFFLLILPHVTLSQTFSLQELITLTSKNLDDFDTYVTKKGFKFQESESEDEKYNVEGATYALNQSEYSKKANKFITLYTKYHNDGDKNIAYQTSLVADYLKIKNQIKLSGFKFSETTVFNGSTFLLYKKGNLELSIVSGQNKDENGRLSTYYEISIKRFAQ